MAKKLDTSEPAPDFVVPLVRGVVAPVRIKDGLNVATLQLKNKKTLTFERPSDMPREAFKEEASIALIEMLLKEYVIE